MIKYAIEGRAYTLSHAGNIYMTDTKEGAEHLLAKLQQRDEDKIIYDFDRQKYFVVRSYGYAYLEESDASSR